MAESTESDHWCHTCNRRVCVQICSSPDGIICSLCETGFVESLQWTPQTPPLSTPTNLAMDESSTFALGTQFLEMLRDFALTEAAQSPAREEDDQLVDRQDTILNNLPDLRIRSRGGRSLVLDWAEILMVFEDRAMDNWIGDYIEAVEFEERARRGAPPASKSAIEGLLVVAIGDEDKNRDCAICKEEMEAGEIKTEMPCGHGYHGDCIVTWLSAKNSCPMCRFELPTDDSDYEETKRKTASEGASTGAGTVSYNSSLV